MPPNTSTGSHLCLLNGRCWHVGTIRHVHYMDKAVGAWLSPFFALLGKVLKKAREDGGRLNWVALWWSAQPWFVELQSLSLFPPVPLYVGPQSLFSQGPATHTAIRRLVVSCLDAVQESLWSRGASSSAVELMTLAHHSETQAVSASLWARWAWWCSKNRVARKTLLLFS